MLVAEHHTPEQLRDLAQPIPQKRLWRRLQAVILAQQGWTAPLIARSLGCSLRSVKNWVTQYNRGGVEALHERPRPRHEDSIPEVQELFKEVVLDQIQAIAEEHPEKEVRVYFEDEARFGTQGTITRVWARRGSRPRAVRQNGREWLYVLMAVCVGTGATSALIMPGLDTEVLNLFLEQFSKELPAGVHAVLIWDGAGYHTSGDLVVPGNVSLIQLPPYSPELNPVENLWHYLRSHHWSNRPYEGYKGLEREAVRSLCSVCNDAERLKSICNADYVRARA
jgi:transposase